MKALQLMIFCLAGIIEVGQLRSYVQYRQATSGGGASPEELASSPSLYQMVLPVIAMVAALKSQSVGDLVTAVLCIGLLADQYENRPVIVEMP